MHQGLHNATSKEGHAKAPGEATGVPLYLKALGAALSCLAFAIVVFQVYSAGDTESIMAGSGVASGAGLPWTVNAYQQLPMSSAACLATSCFVQQQPQRQVLGVKLPEQDPLATKKWPNVALASYTTRMTAGMLKGMNDPLLYIPGLRAEGIAISINGQVVALSAGNLPFFVSLRPPGQEAVKDIEVQVVLSPNSRAEFSGFINKELFYGSSLGVYRAHHNLTNRSFARHAAVLFLLATGALTFAFFIFLDQQRELFALGLTISLLGAAEAVRVGVWSRYGTPTFFSLFSLHIACLSWYVFELARLRGRFTKAVALLPGVALGLYHLLPYTLDAALLSQTRGALLLALDIVPAVAAVTTLMWKGLRGEGALPPRRQAYWGASSALLYTAYLLGTDLDAPLAMKLLGYKISGASETPLLFFNVTWIVLGLWTLGSLEKRVQRAVADQEKRLQLEQEIALGVQVQQAFIPVGLKRQRQHQVLMVYKAAKSIGGDWIAWRDLEAGYALSIIGDVVGKGLQAGLIVSACDAALEQALPLVEADLARPEAALRALVKSLHRAVIVRHPQRAMSLAVVLYSPGDKFWLASLGHPPLLGIHAGGVRILQAGNSWLDQNSKPDEVRVREESWLDDEILLCFTDGVCDGARALKRFRESWQGWQDKDLSDFAIELDKLKPEYDDQSLIVVKRLKTLEQQQQGPRRLNA